MTLQEMVFAVDENDNAIAPVTRQDAHTQHIWHRVAQIWVVNDKKEVLCQKRSLQKDNNPGLWTAFFGGHVGAGESVIEGAIKEVKEEIGLSLVPEDLHYVTKAHSDRGNHIQSAFYVQVKGYPLIHRQEEEVEETKWIPLAELTEILLDTSDTTWVHISYQEEMLEILTKLP